MRHHDDMLVTGESSPIDWDAIDESCRGLPQPSKEPIEAYFRWSFALRLEMMRDQVYGGGWIDTSAGN